MSESGAIVEYILARYGKGRLAVGPEQPNFADYVFWLHFANGSMMPHELIRLICSMLGATDSPILQSLMSRSDRGYALVPDAFCDRRISRVAPARSPRSSAW